MKLDSSGDYIVRISSSHSATLTKTLKKNELIPKCSKVSFYYQLIKISDIKTTYDGEFLADTGGMDASDNNCKNVEIDTVPAINSEIERQRTNNYFDINAKLLIPDPSSQKKLGFYMRSSNKPILSVVKIAASLPENIRLSTNLKFHLRVTELKAKQGEDMTLQKSLDMHEQHICKF
jgi:hypothetical protein